MQTNKQCKFHAGTDCEYTELEPCLRQTNINWYPALSISTYIKHTTEYSNNKSQHSIRTHQPFPAAFLLQAGRDPTPSHGYQLYNQEVSVCQTQNTQSKRDAKSS